MASNLHKCRLACWLSLAVLIVTANLIARLPAAEPASDDSKATSSDSSSEADRLAPRVRLGKLPAIALAPRGPADHEAIARIKKCIAALAEIDSPDLGLSPTISGTAFLPLPGQSESGAMLLTDHHLKSSDALRSLVELGPEALPFLLDALGDKTPTKLTIEHKSGFGAMWIANELSGNPVNQLEANILSKNGAQRDSPNQQSIDNYTVKVGDVCFVAIGQIVGRGYQAVRYQPTACIIINSPTEDAKLREQVRAIWSSTDSRSKLFNSLLLDYSTEGVFQGPSLDSWDLGSELQIAAAMRLLYYYPRETAPLIADRLKQLNVERTNSIGMLPTTDESDHFVRREVANGVRTSDFIKAVSWSREPAVRAAIRDIFARTTDVDILLASLPGGQDFDRKLVGERLSHFLDALPPEEGGAYGDGYNLLVALTEHLGKEAAPMFDHYLKDASAQRCYTAAQVLQQFRGDWCVEILGRLLSDRRQVEGYTYSVSPTDRDSERLKIRVCDAAADTLHLYRRKLKFVMQGDYKNLDQQIATIREKLSSQRRE